MSVSVLKQKAAESGWMMVGQEVELQSEILEGKRSTWYSFDDIFSSRLRKKERNAETAADVSAAAASRPERPRERCG